MLLHQLVDDNGRRDSTVIVSGSGYSSKRLRREEQIRKDGQRLLEIEEKLYEVRLEITFCAIKTLIY